jgi:hypothetical protein
VTAVQALAKQLVKVQTELGRIGALKEERSKLFKLEEERLRIQDRIDSLSNSGRTDIEFNKLRLQLCELAVKRMNILHTQDVSSHNGSTRLHFQRLLRPSTRHNCLFLADLSAPQVLQANAARA